MKEAETLRPQRAPRSIEAHHRSLNPYLNSRTFPRSGVVQPPTADTSVGRQFFAAALTCRAGGRRGSRRSSAESLQRRHAVNAGVFIPKSFLQLTEAEYDWYLDTILKGRFFTAQAAARAMRAKGGAIEQTGSIWAIQAIGATPSAAYSAANAGVHAMVRNLAIELAPYRIRINAVGPAVVETPAYNTFLSPEQVTATLNSLNAFHPLGRNDQPADVADDGGVTAGRQ